MSNAGFTLLWSKILDSSVWMESKETRLVWITLLAMKDVDGVVRAARKALAHRARVTEAECDAALKKLSEPDPQSSTPDNDGRRIEDLEGGGGWQILNHDLYRFSTEAKRAFWREQKAQQREAKKPAGKMPRKSSTAAGRLYEKAEKNGDSSTTQALERMAGVSTAALPEGKTLCEVFAAEQQGRVGGSVPRTPADEAGEQSRTPAPQLEAEDDLGPEFD